MGSTVWFSSEAGSYLRLIDSCITQLKAQGPSRTCYESKEEEEEVYVLGFVVPGPGFRIQALRSRVQLGFNLRFRPKPLPSEEGTTSKVVRTCT